MNNVLITGGLGYIGSHTASILAKNNIKFLIFDNLSNCKIEVIQRLEQIIKKEIDFVEGDIQDTDKLITIIQKKKITTEVLKTFVFSSSTKIVNSQNTL